MASGQPIEYTALISGTMRPASLVRCALETRVDQAQLAEYH